MRLLKIALLSLSLAGAAGTGIALASPAGQGYAITYYDGSGEPVGGALANPCTGAYSHWGAVTSVFTKQTLYCNRP
jgi:hypothetical protein